MKEFLNSGIGKNGPLAFAYHVYKLITKEGVIFLARLVGSAIDGLLFLMAGPGFCAHFDRYSMCYVVTEFKPGCTFNVT
jgi:hypothetical protein